MVIKQTVQKELDRLKDVISEQSRFISEIEEAESIKLTILDSLPMYIAVLNKDGYVTFSNDEWDSNAGINRICNLFGGIGTNYLRKLREAVSDGDQELEAIFNGINSVINREKEIFNHDYICKTPIERIQYKIVVSPLKYNKDGVVMVLHKISHD
ncbi:hypothetical protein H1S01_16725 [Heliobacterium chlorum]|uniref:Uncharacterized protein n=1 Tax=Heliobacterium chlorum TaxID=2698 RepID=A0ABR7T888_HELCL|nr:hypothetical protein [Heliobacterium chlorum]MBC9786114.1 hypothetical protein [Heliobacterium chlorum]